MKPLMSIAGPMILALTAAGTSATVLAQTPGTEFTYQGRLELDGAVANGSHDLRFTLWLDHTDPDPSYRLGPAVCKDNVTVVDGLFAAQLDFGPNVFIGFPLWLEVDVRADTTPGNCASGAFATLAPRQALTPTPYASFAATAGAAGLRLPFDGEASSGPGAALLDLENTLATSAMSFAGIFRVGSTGNNTRAVTGIASGGSGTTYGVFGQSNSTAGVGVHGESFGLAGVRGIASNTSGFTYGVYGESASSTGRGIVGYASHGTGTTYGVWGQVNNPNAYAGYFQGGRNYFSGNVGIGTSNPDEGKLEVLATEFGVFSRTSSTTSGAAVAGEGRYGIYGEANDPGGFGGVFAGAGSFGAGNSLWATGIARIGDRLSIGGSSLSTTPAARLQIENGDDAGLGSNGYAVFGTTSEPNTVIDNNEIMARNNFAAAPLYINHDGGDVIINGAGTGRLGISTNAPQQKLDVAGNIRLTGGVYFGNAVVAPDGFADNVLSFGDPGVGEDYMTYAEGEFWFQDSPGGGDNTGPALYAHDFVSSSDIRLKKDIEPLTGALDKVRQLQGIRYRFDGAKVDPAAENAQDDPRVHIGFSAQAVAAIVPEAAHYSERMDRYGVSYGALVPLLVEAVKEQQTTIEQQQATIAAQQAVIDAICADIHELKTRRPQ